MVHRIAAGATGVASMGVATWGVFTGLSGLPGLSIRRSFISDIATPWNPMAERLNSSLQISGVLLVVFAIVLGLRARSRSGRVAALLAAVAGSSLALVGVYSVTRMNPHLVAAVVCGASAVAASIASAVSARRATRGGELWQVRAGRAAVACAWAISMVLVAGLAYFLWVSARVWPGSVNELLRVLPRELPVGTGSDAYNPLAVGEWLFFALLCAQVVGFAVAEATGLSDRTRQ